MGNAGQSNYAAAKAGMIGFTKSLAREVGVRGITVNAVAPGFIETDMTDNLPNEQKEALASQIPMGRLGTPNEIAKTVLFLAEMVDHILLDKPFMLMVECIQFKITSDYLLDLKNNFNNSLLSFSKIPLVMEIL